LITAGTMNDKHSGSFI